MRAFFPFQGNRFQCVWRIRTFSIGKLLQSYVNLSQLFEKSFHTKCTSFFPSSSPLHLFFSFQLKAYKWFNLINFISLWWVMVRIQNPNPVSFWIWIRMKYILESPKCPLKISKRGLEQDWISTIPLFQSSYWKLFLDWIGSPSKF